MIGKLEMRTVAVQVYVAPDGQEYQVKGDWHVRALDDEYLKRVFDRANCRLAKEKDGSHRTPTLDDLRAVVWELRADGVDLIGDDKGK